MAYAVVSDVVNEFKGLDITAPNSIITTAKIQDYLDQEAGIINTYVGTVYNLPIDPIASPNAFNLLKKIQIDCVACRIEKILNLKKPVNFPAGKAIKQEMNECDMCAHGKQMLADIKDGTLVLDDADNKGTLFSSSYNAANNVNAKFLRDVDQW